MGVSGLAVCECPSWKQVLALGKWNAWIPLSLILSHERGFVCVPFGVVAGKTPLSLTIPSLLEERGWVMLLGGAYGWVSQDDD